MPATGDAFWNGSLVNFICVPSPRPGYVLEVCYPGTPRNAGLQDLPSVKPTSAWNSCLVLTALPTGSCIMLTFLSFEQCQLKQSAPLHANLTPDWVLPNPHSFSDLSSPWGTQSPHMAAGHEIDGNQSHLH